MTFQLLILLPALVVTALIGAGLAWVLTRWPRG